MKKNYSTPKTLLIIVLSLFAWTLISCNKKNCKEWSCEEYDCTVKYPTDIKPIDWENYNDVYTVFWNYHAQCPGKTEDKDKEIMIYGWLYGTTENRCLLVERNSTPHGNPHVIIHVPYHIQTIIDTLVLTKKCFVKGELVFFDFPTNNCCTLAPGIYLIDIDNIYFE